MSLGCSLGAVCCLPAGSVYWSLQTGSALNISWAVANNTSAPNKWDNDRSLIDPCQLDTPYIHGPVSNNCRLPEL